MPSQSDTGMWLFIDTSYVIFYRVYALASWYRRAHPNGPDLGISPGRAGESAPALTASGDQSPSPSDGTPASMTLEEGRALFRAKLIRRLRCVLADTIDAYSADRVLFCLDGERNWRKAYDALYKRNRRQTTFARQLFGDCVREVRAFARERALTAAVLHHPELEADDLVHFLVTQRWATRSEWAPPPRFIIVANDHDYVPLLHLVPPPSLRIVDMRGREVRGVRGVPIADYLMVKILSGDKSDNIQPVFERCGVKTALRLAQNPPELQRRLCQHPGARDRFERNRMLVDNAYALRTRPELRAWLGDQASAQARRARPAARLDNLAPVLDDLALRIQRTWRHNRYNVWRRRGSRDRDVVLPTGEKSGKAKNAVPAKCDRGCTARDDRPAD